MSLSTLTSLAIIKVNLDEGHDYLHSLQPIVLHILATTQPEIITSSKISNEIKDQFGLQIPDAVIQLVLKRLARENQIQKSGGVYKTTGKIECPDFAEGREVAQTHFQEVIKKLIEFSKDTKNPIDAQEQAIDALIKFLSQFGISCLEAYINNTVLPTLDPNKNTDIVLVSSFVLHIQKSDQGCFESFVVLVKCSMLANALACPTLEQAPKTYKSVTFYFDTPLLIQLLGFDGDARQKSVQHLIQLVSKYKGKIAIFAHTREELDSVLHYAIQNFDNPRCTQKIVLSARSAGKTKSDLMLAEQKINEDLSKQKIEIKQPPRYSPQNRKYEIDETALEEALRHQIPTYKDPAIRCDIKSVRGIYVLRKNATPDALERSKAVLVTSNSSYARAAWQYDVDNNKNFSKVSSVITDISLMNVAWLKSPVDTGDTPKIELLAIAYAAMQPPERFWKKYLDECSKLADSGDITTENLQILRSRYVNPQELMNLTLGEDDALSAETIIEILRVAVSSIQQEEHAKTLEEESAHRKTKEQLKKQYDEINNIRDAMRSQCRKTAKIYSWAIVVAIALSFGIFSFVNSLGIPYYLDWMASALIAIFSIVYMVDWAHNLLPRKIGETLEQKLYDRCVRRNERRYNLNISEQSQK